MQALICFIEWPPKNSLISILHMSFLFVVLVHNLQVCLPICRCVGLCSVLSLTNNPTPPFQRRRKLGVEKPSVSIQLIKRKTEETQFAHFILYTQPGWVGCFPAPSFCFCPSHFFVSVFLSLSVSVCLNLFLSISFCLCLSRCLSVSVCLPF